jgi:hypothetical protein
MTQGATLMRQVAALWRNLFQNRLMRRQEEYASSVTLKDSNHVTSNDLLVGCVGHHRHRVHCHDFN